MRVAAKLKYDAHQYHASQSKKLILFPGSFILGVISDLIFKEWKCLDEFREMVSTVDIASIEDSTYK